MPSSIAVLTYHSLDDSGCVLATPPRLFAEQMQSLHDLGVTVVSLTEVGRLLEDASTPGRLLALTFDDGFQNVYEHGLPILQRYGFTATVFVITDYCGKSNDWPGQPSRIVRRSLLRWSEIREMSAAGIDFGCHTRTHPNLTRMCERDAEAEMVASRQTLEDAVGRPVGTFAYPYGAYDDPIRRLAERHFSLACSAQLGFVRARSDPWALERLDVYYLRHPILFQRLFAPEVRTYLRLRRSLRELKTRVLGLPEASPPTNRARCAVREGDSP